MEEIKNLIKVLEEELKKLPTEKAQKEIKRGIKNAKEYIQKQRTKS